MAPSSPSPFIKSCTVETPLSFEHHKFKVWTVSIQEIKTVLKRSVCSGCSLSLLLLDVTKVFFMFIVPLL